MYKDITIELIVGFPALLIMLKILGKYVILERDGQISIVPKHAYAPPTKQDFTIPNQQTHLPIALVMDGKQRIRSNPVLRLRKGQVGIIRYHTHPSTL